MKYLYYLNLVVGVLNITGGFIVNDPFKICVGFFCLLVGLGGLFVGLENE